MRYWKILISISLIAAPSTHEKIYKENSFEQRALLDWMFRNRCTYIREQKIHLLRLRHTKHTHNERQMSMNFDNKKSFAQFCFILVSCSRSIYTATESNDENQSDDKFPFDFFFVFRFVQDEDVEFLLISGCHER